MPIAYYAAKYGVDIDLLTRGAGFRLHRLDHHLADLCVVHLHFFALEAAIMSLALGNVLRHSAVVGYVISSLVVIPLVTHGITFISRFQLWTQPIWLVLHFLPFVFIAA